MDRKIKLICLCQWMKNPVGIENKNPQISWYLENEFGTQKSYRIKVSENNDFQKCVWDSGVQESNETEAIYQGEPLKSGTKYYYEVCVQTDDEKEYVSENDYFITGIMEDVSWDDAWIGGAGIRDHSLRFRCELTIEEPVHSAVAFVTSPNYYLLSCNGKKCGDMVLNNARTDYQKTLLYETWEVPIGYGKNTIGVEVGNGWYCMELGNRPVSKSEHLFALLLRIEYESGKVEWKKSNHDNWMFTTKCPVIYDNIYHGETYDARREQNGWDENAFAMGEDWRHAFEQDTPGGRIKSQEMEPIRITEVIEPKEIYHLDNGDYTVDFGQNFAGWVRIRLDEEEGHSVKLKHAEVIYSDHTINPVSLKNARATDEYISGGKELIYEPRFSWHGFQYVQISGITGELKKEDIKGCVVGSDVERIGRFHCSDQLLNQIYKNMIWTERSNLQGLPIDCPQRDERLGWLNDMTVRNEGALYNFGLVQLYRKWMGDIRDTQGKHTGALSDTAPFVHMGQKPADPVSTAALLVPWNVYCHTGDKSILEENFQMMKAWTDYMRRNSKNYIMEYSPMGDWASPVKWTDSNSIGAGAVSRITPSTYMGTGYLYYNYCLLEKTAEILGKQDESEKFGELAAKVKESFLKTYYNGKGQFAKNSQASNAFALLLGMVEGEEKKKVIAELVKDIEENEYHLTTGNLCSRYVIEVLFKEGYCDVAYKLLVQKTYPSWGYMIENGATTMWERWEKVEEPGPEGGMASRNHPMTGAVGVCFHKYIAGIQVDENNPGFRKIIVAPCIPSDIRFAEAELKTIHGTIKSSWEKTEKDLTFEVVIPFNIEGEFQIPEQYKEKEVSCDGILINHNDCAGKIRLQSGIHKITIK